MTESSFNTVYKDEIWRDIRYICSPPSRTYLTFVNSYHTVQANPRESRPYPVDLVASMTGQTRQYRQDRYLGRYCTVSRPTDWSCPGPVRPTYENLTYVNKDFATEYPCPINNTNWQLRLRNTIGDRAVNLGTALAEYRATADMFEDFGKGLCRAMRGFRQYRRDLAAGRNPRLSLTGRPLRLSDVAAAELMASYGLVPLARDLGDSYKALFERLHRPLLSRFSVYSRDSDAGSDTVSTYWNRKWRWDVSQRATAYVNLEADARGLTSANPLALAWELIPYSFVVDTMVNIGDTLMSLDALKSVSGVKGTVTTKRWYSHDITFDPGLYPSEARSVRPALMKYDSHERSVFTDIPLPRVPRWEPSSSWHTVANMVSLLVVTRDQTRR